jgi:hypothetical protein
MHRCILVGLLGIVFPVIAAVAEDDLTGEPQDSSMGLPKEYADKYLIASQTISPDKKFALMYPRLSVCEEDVPKDSPKNLCKDFLVQREPFRVITTLDTDWPHFQNKSHGGISAAWSRDSSVVLVTLDSKWGPGDIFLYELSDEKVTRSTNLSEQIRKLLEPDFKAANAEPFNDIVNFVFDTEGVPLCHLEGKIGVQIQGMATTDPKESPGVKAWDARVEAVWNIPQAKFTSQKVVRLFAGVRKGDEGD